MACFEKFINHYRDKELIEINENDIRQYLKQLIQEKRSDSYLSQMTNRIKFTLEVVQEMPTRYFEVERRQKNIGLPKSISRNRVRAEKDIVDILTHRENKSLFPP